MSSGPPVRVAALAVLALLTGIAPGSPSAALAGQAGEVGVPDGPPRLTVAAHPDTVKVGEPFILGVTVRATPGTPVTLPVWLEIGEHLEQRGPAEIRPEDGGTTRAYYRLAAWRVGEANLPGLEVFYGEPAAERSLSVQPPTVAVRSVLPAQREELELRGARPFLDATRPPWPWILAILLVLAAAGILWALRRRERGGPADAAGPADPADRALAELEGLRRDWARGGVDGPGFYDGWEGTLRRYVGATRDWRPGRPLPPLVDGDRLLARSFERSALVRFARVETDPQGPDLATEAAVGWILADRGSVDRAAGENGVGAGEGGKGRVDRGAAT